MKPRSMAPTLTTLAIAFTACETGVAPLTDADVAAIGEVREAYRQAVLAGDAAAIASVYTTDGVEMPPNMPAAEGHDAIQAANESPMDVSEFHITSVETVGFGDFAFDRGTFTFTGMIEGLPAIADTGKYMVIVRGQPDGSWLSHRTIWSSDLPLPVPEAGEMP